MKLRWLATGATFATLTLVGCGSNDAPPGADTTPLEIEGSWTYLGPSDGPHTLTIAGQSMTYTDVDGKWGSSWSIVAHDNGLHRFQVAFDSGSGAYLPVGQKMSGAYVLNGSVLTIQLANGASYPAVVDPGTCTDPSANGAPVPDCRLYIKQ